MEESKMAAPESTKFQVNFKTPDGTLINLYAASKEELEGLLSAAQDFSALIGSVSQSLGGASAPAPVRSAASSVAPVVASGGSPSCRHGAMNLRSGVNAKGKSWSGYMCSAPKGAVDKCETIWA
jgi:hypothetical protein